MTYRDFLDQPPYDPVQFETERLARAAEFAKAARNLARFDMRESEVDPADKWIMRGANYVLPNDKELDVMRQGYFAKPVYATTAVRLSGPWTEHVGADGLRRRVRKIRDISYSIAPDFNEPGEHDDDESHEVPTYLEKAVERLQFQRERDNFEKSMDLDYRPPELIEAKSGAIVEVKLNRGPNWRTERTDRVSSQSSRLAHFAAMRQAGVEEDNREYSVEEHEELIFLLQMIRASRFKARRLEQNII